jgi:hypothetical protein
MGVAHAAVARASHENQKPRRFVTRIPFAQTLTQANVEGLVQPAQAAARRKMTSCFCLSSDEDAYPKSDPADPVLIRAGSPLKPAFGAMAAGPLRSSNRRTKPSWKDGLVNALSVPHPIIHSFGCRIYSELVEQPDEARAEEFISGINYPGLSAQRPVARPDATTAVLEAFLKASWLIAVRGRLNPPRPYSV